MLPTEFLEQIAKAHGVSSSEMEVLSAAITGEAMSEIAKRLGLRPEAARKRLGEVYKKFQISGAGPGKLAKLQQILVTKFAEYQDGGATPNHFKPIPKEPVPDSNTWLGAGFPALGWCHRRTGVLANLQDMVESGGTQLVLLTGMEGAGKTVLSAQFAAQYADGGIRDFEFVVWRSLNSSPHNLSALIRFLGDDLAVPSNPRDRINVLMSLLREHRCLLIFDGWDVLFQPGELAGTYRRSEEELRDFLDCVVHEQHQSCVMVASSELPMGIAGEVGGSFAEYNVPDLGATEAESILAPMKVLAEGETLRSITDQYRGNPSMLKIAISTICDVFGGDINAFCSQPTRVFGAIREVMERSLARLSPTEKDLLFHIVTMVPPITLGSLREQTTGGHGPSAYIEVLQSLVRRSLIESDTADDGTPCFKLPPIVQESILLSNPGLQTEFSRAEDSLKLLIEEELGEADDAAPSSAVSLAPA
ncbi:MAG: NACHT domain-containing protein [Cyanobacteria bacterium P01_H01_bin.130]